MDDSSHENSPNYKPKGGPKSYTSYRSKGAKIISVKKFRDFKPKAQVIAQLEKPDFEEDPDVIAKNQEIAEEEEYKIDKLRRKVEVEAKRRKIDEDLKKKKRRVNHLNAIGVGGASVGNGPYTTDYDGKVLPVKHVNAKRLTSGNYSTVDSKIDDHNLSISKIEGLEHLYSIPPDSDTHTKLKNELAPENDKDKNVQEITALQVWLPFY